MRELVTLIAFTLLGTSIYSQNSTKILSTALEYPGGNIQSKATIEGNEGLWKFIDNGSEDDGIAIQSALDNPEFKMISLLPGKKYQLKSSLHIPTNSNLNIPSGTILQYTGSSFWAISLETFSTLTGDGTIQKVAAWDIGQQNSLSKAALQICGSNIKVDLGTIEGFEYGINAGDGYGIQCCNIYVRNIYDVIIGIYIHPNDTGWVNNNYFHFDQAGEHRTTGNKELTKLWNEWSTGIFMETNRDPDLNTFSGHIEGYNTGIRLAGAYNRIESMRFESCKVRIKIVGSSTRDNYIFGEYGQLSGLESSSGKQLPVDNQTGKNLYEVLNVFGWDGYTYLNNVKAKGYTVSSDERNKENITGISDALNKIMALHGTEYIFKSSPININGKTDKSIGFIAQELKKVLPDLVDLNPIDLNYSINYDGIIPVLVEAFKEQQEIIQKNQARLDTLIKTNQKLMEILNAKGIITNNEFKKLEEIPILYQQTPNRFNTDTKIEYYLPKSTKKAYILVMDMNGKLLKKLEIQTPGKNEVVLKSSKLNPGMYTYSLISDDKIIDTKRMVLIE